MTRTIIQRALLFLVGMALPAAFYFFEWNTPSSSAAMPNHKDPTGNPPAKEFTDANQLIRRGFSVSRAMDIFRTTREDKRDFLTLYVRNDLPDYISKSDIELLEHSLRTFQPQNSSVANNFKTGMLYFFLALTETIWLVEGNPIDSNTVGAHWEESVSRLKRAEAIGQDFSREIETILHSADSDSNGQLTSSELSQMILDRE